MKQSRILNNHLITQLLHHFTRSAREEIRRLATQVDYEYQVVFSDHVVSDAWFEQMTARRELLYRTLQKEAVDLWTPGKATSRDTQ